MSTTAQRGAVAGESEQSPPAVPLAPLVEMQGLSVRFGNREILRSLTATLRGRSIGLLGPNGAGKSTLINTLLGFYKSSAGSARVFGYDVGTGVRKIRGLVGYMPENDAFISKMSAVSFVQMMGELSGLPPDMALERAHEALFYVGLAEARYRKLGTYSLGMKQLAKLAQAIVHGPKLLILDEPTNGLDPSARQRMIRMIKDIRDGKEMRIVLCSHLLRDRIAQISDLHLGDWLTPAQLAQVVRVVNQQRPDLIAVTGDFVTLAAERHAADLVATLRPLAARDGVVAVLGNHDYWSDAPTIRAVIHASGMRDLSNRVLTLERDGAPLHIAGVDDVWEAHARLDDVLAALPAAGPAILLAHEPDFADTSAATGRFALQISGHSHGGQVVVPRYGPLRLPPYGRRYPLGRYRVGAMLQYTNRGIGMLRPHVRLNCRPEITVFTLAATG